MAKSICIYSIYFKISESVEYIRLVCQR